MRTCTHLRRCSGCSRLGSRTRNPSSCRRLVTRCTGSSRRSSTDPYWSLFTSTKRDRAEALSPQLAKEVAHDEPTKVRGHNAGFDDVERLRGARSDAEGTVKRV